MKAKLALVATLALGSAYAQLPEAPKPQTIDKPFVFTAIADAASMGADFTLSVQRISHSHNPCVVETSSIYGKHPSPGDYAKVMIPVTVGANVLSYFLKKHKSKIWALPQAIDGITHFVGFVSNTHNRENWPCNLR